MVCGSPFKLPIVPMPDELTVRGGLPQVHTIEGVLRLGAECQTRSLEERERFPHRHFGLGEAGAAQDVDAGVAPGVIGGSREGVDVEPRVNSALAVRQRSRAIAKYQIGAAAGRGRPARVRRPAPRFCSHRGKLSAISL
jgi:hypothetical protein